MPPTARQRPAQQPPLHPALSARALSSRASQHSGTRLRIPRTGFSLIFVTYRDMTVTPVARGRGQAALAIAAFRMTEPVNPVGNQTACSFYGVTSVPAAMRGWLIQAAAGRHGRSRLPEPAGGTAQACRGWGSRDSAEPRLNPGTCCRAPSGPATRSRCGRPLRRSSRRDRRRARPRQRPRPPGASRPGPARCPAPPGR